MVDQVKENLGPAERIINTLLTHSDHAYHGRPGMVTPAQGIVNMSWQPVTHKEEEGQKVVYKLTKVGRKSRKVKVGILWKDGTIRTPDRRKIAEYRPSGLFPEVAVWMYRSIAEVFKLNNEFAARWASHAYMQDHRDMKVALAAFMLVQDRHGEPIREGDEVLFHDDDYRDVGEAMMLLYDKKGGKDLNPRLLLRIHDFLSLPEVAQINRDLGFGKSARKPFLGRWPKATRKWLAYREDNPKLLEGLVKAGFRRSVMELARRSGYKPTSEKFFEILRWKQKQSDDGRRTIAIGKEVAAAESWDGLSEEQICLRIVESKPNYKRIVGLLPKEVGLTKAIVAAAVEAGCLSDKDLIILTPTLEEFGLLKDKDVKKKWDAAIKKAEDMRAANIATRVRSKEVKEKLEEAADTAAQKAVEEVSKNIRVYFILDCSGSMTNTIELAKGYISKFLQSFPLDRLHVCAFDTQGYEVTIKHPSSKGVEQAFRGVRAGGGTSHASAIRCLRKHQPKDDEDVLFFFVGDEGERGSFARAVAESGLRPMAFALIKIGTWDNCSIIRDTAVELQIPCFEVNTETFKDPYAIPRVIRNLVSATPVGKKVMGTVAIPRVSLVDTILKTELLKKPVWAA